MEESGDAAEFLRSERVSEEKARKLVNPRCETSTPLI